MANIKDFIKKIGNSAVSLEEQQQALAQVEQTIIEAKQKRTEAIGKNAEMVIQALKTIESKLEAKLKELNNTPAKQGIQGPAGKDGRDGKDGKNGRDGVNGKDGKDGKDGVDGTDGVSVVDAKIDFDGSLVVYLSNGNEIDCGQILQPEVAKNIIISSGGSGTSQVVTDTLVSLQNQINTLTGIDGVLGDMAQQNANAVAITGGTINGTTIGATTPSTGVFSDLTDSGLTSGRVTYAGTGGNLRDASNFTYDGTNLQAGAIQNTPIGSTTANTGKFTTLETTGTSTLGTASSQYLQAAGGSTEAQLSAQGAGTNIPLVLQPKGTGAIQAQATTSTTAGGNARGANAVDWQTSRNTAVSVASGNTSTISGGFNNAAASFYSVVGGGRSNQASSGNGAAVFSGFSNTTTGEYAAILGGYANNANGYFNIIGGGFTNTGTSSSAVTTQATTTVTNGSTAVTLSGSNASIKVGQLITGTGIVSYTYVAAISGTSLTLSQNANATGTPTLSFYTPHGVVVGGGNNQATGAYSFIGGGGDAGTAGNRNTASGDWSFVGGGRGNTASGIGAVVCGGGLDGGASVLGSTASSVAAFVGGGLQNQATATGSSILGGYQNIANGTISSVLAGRFGNTRSIAGNTVIPACNTPIAGVTGVSQSALLILARETTDATPTVLASNSSAAGTTNQVILPNNSAYYFKIEVIAGKTAAGDSKAVELKGAIKRGANAASTTLIGSVTSTVIAEDAGASAWTAVATADTTNGGIKLTVTGQASTTIRWVARCTTTEMTF